MKPLAFFFSFAIFLHQLCAAEFQQRIAFERDGFVWVANRDGSAAKQVAVGSFPAISPDATRLAFTTTEKISGNYSRRIATADIATGITNLFREIPGNNPDNASWSPDGKKILFTLRAGNVWDLGVIDADGTNFQTVKNGSAKESAFYSPVWSRDSESIFCQDMTNIYRLDLKGAVLAQWKIETIIPNGSMSGDGRIMVSPDGKRLLLSCDMAEENDRKDWNGPPPALWSFDLQTQKATRITPKKIFGWDGCWLDKDNILFLSRDVKEKEPSLYRMSLGKSGKDRKLVIKNARMPSASM
jgi:TolB protein